MSADDRVLFHRARELRNKLTIAETSLWYQIRRDRFGIRFYRQKVIGRYIVDFYSPKAKLVIEIDGGQHYSERYVRRDRLRDDWLQRKGLKVLRFDNYQVLKQMESVLAVIQGAIEQQIPPNLPFQKGRL